MKTSPTNLKIRQIINLVREGRLIPRPEFQRRLVWKTSDKNHFLDSILGGFPFPEIYVADGDVDLESGEGTQLLVDGLQRISTITQYFHGDPELKLTAIPAYKDLPDDQKTAFLLYDVAVRDLGNVSTEQIVEVFRRINATSYSLTDIEIHNARFRGALKELAETISVHNFFADHKIFTALDYRRMGDIRFTLSVIITILVGYFNRDDSFEELLEAYNDEFAQGQEIREGLYGVFEFIEECGFDRRSRVWRKSDAFTMIIEMYIALVHDKLRLDPSAVVEIIGGFFKEVDEQELTSDTLAGIYYKATVQASNDRLNRVRRGIIIAGLLRSYERERIVAELDADRLI